MGMSIPGFGETQSHKQTSVREALVPWQDRGHSRVHEFYSSPHYLFCGRLCSQRTVA